MKLIKINATAAAPALPLVMRAPLPWWTAGWWKNNKIIRKRKEEAQCSIYAVFAVDNMTRAQVIQRAASPPPGTPWSEVSEDFECHLCNVGKEFFEEA